MIQLLTGLFMRGHRVEPLERNVIQDARPKRKLSWVKVLRGIAWAAIGLMLAFAFVGVVILSVPLPDGEVSVVELP